MEKLRIAKSKQFCNRLLKIITTAFLFFLSSVNAITPKEIQSLVIKPETNVFFTNQELKYVLEIPGVVPAEVQTQLSENMKEGVSFVSSRRMEYFTSGDSTGTRIEFWFIFKNTGLGEIPPLVAKVKNRTYYLPFEKIQLYENPKTIAPRLFVQINGDKEIVSDLEATKKVKEVYSSKVTEPIELLVYIQYAVQIKQFGYELPRNSLFEEVERYEIIKGKTRSNEFSPEKVAVIKIKWTPLKEGNFAMPNLRLLATAYSGRSVELALPECSFKIEKKSEEIQQTENKKEIFSYALSEPKDKLFSFTKKSTSELDYYRIAALRSDERHSFFSMHAIRKERKDLEQSVGIVASQNEKSMPLWHVLFIFFVLFTCGAIMFFIAKKKIASFICVAFAIIFSFFSLIMGLSVFEKCAIVKGGTISPVPEESALSCTSVSVGTRVKICEQTDAWYYIEYNENGGWIKKDNLILIQ